jgi:ribosomal protein L34E
MRNRSRKHGDISQCHACPLDITSYTRMKQVNFMSQSAKQIRFLHINTSMGLTAGMEIMRQRQNTIRRINPILKTGLNTGGRAAFPIYV